MRRLSLELFGILLLVAFVVGLATMPPLNVTRNPKSPAGYTITVDSKAWKANVTRYWNVVRHGTLGQDRRGAPVIPLVLSRLGRSLVLLGLAVSLALLFGVVKGFADFRSMRRRRVALGPLVTSVFAGVPDFWLVLMLQIMATYLWRWFDFNAFKVTWDSQQQAASMVYPVLALSLIPLAHVARITATAMSNVYGKEYVRTARAKGLTEFVVVYKHALRGALVQMLDSLPGVMAVMLSNLLIVEYMFSYPGLTLLLKEAIAPDARVRTGVDVPVLVLAGVCIGLIFSFVYLLVRILRRVADPRLKGRDLA